MCACSSVVPASWGASRMLPGFRVRRAESSRAASCSVWTATLATSCGLLCTSTSISEVPRHVGGVGQVWPDVHCLPPSHRVAQVSA
jgi:hypothetical protein